MRILQEFIRQRPSLYGIVTCRLTVRPLTVDPSVTEQVPPGQDQSQDKRRQENDIEPFKLRLEVLPDTAGRVPALYVGLVTAAAPLLKQRDRDQVSEDLGRVP